MLCLYGRVWCLLLAEKVPAGLQIFDRFKCESALDQNPQIPFPLSIFVQFCSASSAATCTCAVLQTARPKLTSVCGRETR